MNDTIFALSTGDVKAAVAIIRVSGPEARNIAATFCNKTLSPRRAELVSILHHETSEVLDIGLVVWFPAPHSYTGEDIVEFQSHGGSAVVDAILSALASAPGLRLADQGEFTRRAFHNGKMDLDSIEGLADLLDADTQFQRREALHRLQGKLGSAADMWRQELLGIRALIEASLDFSSEADVPLDIYNEVVQRIEIVTAKVAAAIDRSRRQEVISGGFVVLIAGPPNAGKSTLLNCLVQKDVAITSEFAGTTRDLIEVVLQLGGMRIVLVDTAGIRDTEDPVEKMGLEKSFRRAREANLILLLSNDENVIEPDFRIDSEAKLVRVRGKKDIYPTQYPGLAISAVTGEGIDELLEIIRTEAEVFFNRNESAPVIRQRQSYVASELLSHLQSANSNATSGAFELCAEDLALGTRCLSALVENTGTEDVLDEVFYRFCLGK